MEGAQPAQASFLRTNVSGAIITDTTWSLAGSPYLVSNVSIDPSATLRIEAGVVLKLNGSLVVSGKLVAKGTEASPIVFTSVADDAVGGDTNGDGNNTAPAPGQWAGIYVSSTGEADMEYVTLRYAGYYASLRVDGGKLNLAHSTISHGAYDGLGLWSNASFTLTNVLVANNAGNGLSIASNAPFRITNSKIYKNAHGIYASRSVNGGTTIHQNHIYSNGVGITNINPAVALDATHNYWGDPSGPKHATNPSGLGNAVSDGVIFDPWLPFSMVEPSESELMALPIGSTTPLKLQPLQPLYLKVSPEADRDLLLSLDISGIATQTAIVRMLTHAYQIPAPYAHELVDETTATTTHSELAIAPTLARSYYILLYAPFLRTGSLDVNVRAEYKELHLINVSPNQAGNAGDLTIKLYGTGLSRNVSTTLISPSGQRITSREQVPDSRSSMFATFDLHGVEIGNYTVEVKQPSDNAIASLTNAINVTQGSGGRLKVRLEGPDTLRPGRVYEYTLFYENVGDADMLAPYLSVSSTEPGVTFFADGFKSEQQLIWLASGFNTRGDLLPVGAKGHVRFQVVAQASTTLRVGVVEENEQPFEWESIKSRFSELTISASSWDSIVTQLGSTRRQVLGNLRTLHSGVVRPVILDNLIKLMFWSTTPNQASSQLVQASSDGDYESVEEYLDETIKKDVTLQLYNGITFTIVPTNPIMPILNANKPIIFITHGWTDGSKNIEWLAMAKQLQKQYTTHSIIFVSWEIGAQSPPISCKDFKVDILDARKKQCQANHVSKRISRVADEVRSRLESLGYSKWADIIYIGHSFGNAVNAFISKGSIDAGKSLLLNPASPLGFGDKIEPTYSSSFASSIAIFTSSLGDNWWPSSRYSIRYSPTDCHGVECDNEGSHGSGKPLLICWLSDPSEKINNDTKYCGNIIRDQPSLAKAFIEVNDKTLQLDDISYFFVDPQGRLTKKTPTGEKDCLFWGLVCTPVYNTITYTITPQAEKTLTVVRPIDPNDKIGPTGFGTQRMVAADGTLNYTINFENVGSATAPVQELQITDDLDPNLDWSTLRLTSIAYGGHVLTLDQAIGDLQYAERDNPPASVITGTTQGEMLVDIAAALDIRDGRIKWLLRTIDSATDDLPTDALAGFLLPEDGTGRGQGYVSYSIKPKTGITPGTVIKNKASIIFDTNEAIATNEVFNTLVDSADLVLLADASTQTSINSVATLTYTLFNDGPNPAANVIITGFAGSGLPIQSLVSSVGACSVDTCQIPAFAADQQATITLTLQANALGRFTTTVNASGLLLDPNAVDNRATQVLTVINHAPLFTSRPVTQVQVTANYEYQITASDPDPSDTATLSALTLPSWLTIGATVNGQAMLSGTPGSGNAGLHSVVLLAVDKYGGTTQQAFTITVANGTQAYQSITFLPITTKTYGDPPIVLSATASSGLVVIITSLTPATCTVNGNIVTLMAAGRCTLRASQPGDSNFAPALAVEQTFTIEKATQVIQIGLLIPKTVGDAAFVLPVAATSGLPVTLSSLTNTICSVNDIQVTPIAQGICRIAVEQAGNGNFKPATAVEVSFEVKVHDPNKLSQTISFEPSGDKTYGEPPFTLSASASSALSVTFASQTPAVCTVVDNIVTLVGVGNCIIRASQPGNDQYNSAVEVDQHFSVRKAPQSIRFDPIAPISLSKGSFILPASASSGLAITFTALDTSVCTVQANVVTLLREGTCSLTATQPGNDLYEPALAVTQAFIVLPAGVTQKVFLPLVTR